jgi:hypothetical protein
LGKLLAPAISLQLRSQTAPCDRVTGKTELTVENKRFHSLTSSERLNGFLSLWLAESDSEEQEFSHPYRPVVSRATIATKKAVDSFRFFPFG